MRQGDADEFLGGMRVSEFPFVVVRIDCHLCLRRGAYRLARIAERFGAETALATVLSALAMDCPWRPAPGSRHPGKYERKCRAKFTDLRKFPPRPLDLPPAMAGLRLVVDNKRKAG